MIFVLDASGSMDGRFDLEQQLTRRIIWGLNFAGSRTRVGVVTFQSYEKVQFHLQKYNLKESILNAIAFNTDMSAIGTNTARALSQVWQVMFSLSNGDRNGVENVAIVMSDGRSNLNYRSTLPEATRVKDNGIRLLAVGIGDNVNIEEINGMASVPETTSAFYLKNQTDIENIANIILDQLCT